MRANDTDDGVIGRSARPPGFVQLGGPPAGPPPMMGPPPMGPPGPPAGPPPVAVPFVSPFGAPPMVERSFAGVVGAGNRGSSSRLVHFDDDDGGDFMMEGVVVKPKKSKWRPVSKKKIVQVQDAYQVRASPAPAPYMDPGYPQFPGFFVPAYGNGPPPMAAYVRR